MEMPSTLQSHFRVLLARKEQQERRTISLREVQRTTKAPMSTVSGLANNTLREIPVEPVAAICRFLDCAVGELLEVVDLPPEKGRVP